MKKMILLLGASLFLSNVASADILMKWERKPLPIELQVEKERIVFVEKNVKVGYPAQLEGKLRIQSTGGAVYFKALNEFPKTRLQLVDLASGELILLDVEGKASVPNATEPVRFTYIEKLEKQSAIFNQDSHETPDLPEVKPQLPVPAALTRYAAQMFYAPLRTVEPLEGVRQVAHRLPSRITTLLPAYPVQATPLLSWQMDNYVVTAIRLQNRGSSRIELDPRELQGRFYAATFQHAWLGGHGSPEDTTTLYLVTEGYANQALIPETQQYKTKKLKKVTTTTTVMK
ncbi:TIGR03749 family integrating conjugative element protein [Aggregatibacter actinomycetemcomitans]|uniref:TIGR03749 family integrating conjugative element protein n=1 Tax=Aggregatibacter actinomycetemcomitans TaxID=714 RepID=UPI0011DB6A57|nr:TIGR03749 family integrating conjugative element protein [Aggregatibacter actinomycetemcomitans]TYA47774.1 TIGR03749 family integrating conjugative element protein [Aggregatibacter actinomycetemcomitans]